MVNQYNLFLEIFLEWLPISSSGHLLLYSYFFSWCTPLPPVLNYLGHVLILPWQCFALLYLCYKNKTSLLRSVRATLHIGWYTIIITFITGIFHSIFKTLIPSTVYSSLLPIGFLLTIIILIFINTNNFFSKKIDTICLQDAVYCGLIQSISVLPGLSRLGVMLFCGKILGFSKKDTIILSLLSNIGLSGVSIIAFTYSYLKTPELIYTFSLSSFFIYGSLISFFGMMAFFIFYHSFLKNKIQSIIWYELIIFILSFSTLFIKIN